MTYKEALKQLQKELSKKPKEELVDYLVDHIACYSGEGKLVSFSLGIEIPYDNMEGEEQ